MVIDDDLVRTSVEVFSAGTHSVGFGYVNSYCSRELSVKDHSVFAECLRHISIRSNIEKKSRDSKEVHVLREFFGHCDICFHTYPAECLAKTAGRTHAVSVNTLMKEDEAHAVLFFESGSHIDKLSAYAFGICLIFIDHFRFRFPLRLIRYPAHAFHVPHAFSRHRRSSFRSGHPCAQLHQACYPA